MKRLFLATTIALLSGCAQAPKPGDAVYIEQKASYSDGSFSTSSEGWYVSNAPKDAKQFDRATRPWLNQLEGWPFGVEMLEYNETDCAKTFYIELQGSPESAYNLLNLVKNEGDLLSWYIARLENDGDVNYHKIYKNILMKSGKQLDTDMIWMLKKANNAAVPLLLNETDGETLSKLGINNALFANKYTGCMPRNFAKYLKDLSSADDKERELSAFNKYIAESYRALKADVESVAGYAWPITQTHIDAENALKKLDADGAIVHFWPFKLVNGMGYYDFVIKVDDKNYVLIEEGDVSELAQDPMRVIKSKPKMVIK